MKVPNWIVPPLIVLFTLLGLGAARLMAIPSVTLEFPAARQADAARRVDTVTLLVDGVRCVDTARRAASTLEDVAGVLSYTAYASRNRVEVGFDPDVTSAAQVAAALEGPVWEKETGEILFHQFKVLEIDGQPISR
jgi:hypothetical protein